MRDIIKYFKLYYMKNFLGVLVLLFLVAVDIAPIFLAVELTPWFLLLYLLILPALVTIIDYIRRQS